MSARLFRTGALIVVAVASCASTSLRAAGTDRQEEPWAAAVRIASPLGVITSTFRTVAHNRAVGGVADSYHLLGQAIDVVRRPGVSHARLAAALRAGGLNLIESLDEGNHSHFAFGTIAKAATHVRFAIRAKLQPSPPKNLLAADTHGTLRVDLGRLPPPSTILTPGGAPARSETR